MTDQRAEQDWIRPDAPDAPIWMNSDQAHGWACGWEAALDHYRSLPVEQRAADAVRHEDGFGRCPCPECDDIVELIPDAVQPCECGRIVGPTEHHCWWHHTDENPDGAYRVCGECFHVYRTAADLEYACREVNGGRHVPAEKIDACPECCHDF